MPKNNTKYVTPKTQPLGLSVGGKQGGKRCLVLQDKKMQTKQGNFPQLQGKGASVWGTGDPTSHTRPSNTCLPPRMCAVSTASSLLSLTEKPDLKPPDQGLGCGRGEAVFCPLR